jgi:hypothetical protein
LKWRLVNFFTKASSIVIFSISASQVAKIIDVSHWHLVCPLFFIHFLSTLFQDYSNSCSIFQHTSSNSF